jgi:serine/threonine protein phosphatase 1
MVTQRITEESQRKYSTMGRLFAISDIHGCFKPFYELVVNVIELKKSDRLILLGDYIDRGEQSKEVIDFIIDLQKTGFDIKALIGNHELMLIDSWYDPDYMALWSMNGGLLTLQSFGVENIREIDNGYLEFFNSLGYYLVSGNVIFVHAGFNDFAPDPFLDKQGMVWECRLSYQNPMLTGKTIIHGHRPKTISNVKRMLNEHSPVIPIDTGCVYAMETGYGFLSALEVNSMSLFSVANF